MGDLINAITSSGEMPEGDIGAVWDRVLARLENEPIEISGQPKAGCSWLISTTSPDE
jgi:hypothetical protein